MGDLQARAGAALQPPGPPQPSAPLPQCFVDSVSRGSCGAVWPRRLRRRRRRACGREFVR
eukprot:7446134-Alexandrium_andersonii.AAC.1